MYANNNPIRYIDYLGLSARDTTIYEGPELEPVVCVGQKKSKTEAGETVSENTSVNNSSSLFNIYLAMLKKWWKNSLYYEEKEVDDRMSQDLSYLVDFSRITSGKVNVLSKDSPYYDKVFWRRFWPRKERDKIEGDIGAIEATIDDKFKEHLEESNEPANEPNQQVDDSVFVRYRLGDYRTYTKYFSVNDTSGMDIIGSWGFKSAKKMNRTSLIIIIIIFLLSCGRKVEITDKTTSLGYEYDYRDGKLSMVKHFIQVDSMRYLNQYIRFDNEGNLQKHLSHYFTLISFKDTIKQNETTTIRIELDAPKYFGGMQVIIGNYDKNFILPDDMVLDTIDSEENSFVVFYDLKIHQLGDTIIRGCILNFQEEFHNGEVLIKERPLYFSKHFFVTADK